MKHALKNPFAFCVIALLVSLGACSSVQLKKYDHDPEAKISNYKTFYFADVNRKSEIPTEYQFRIDILKEEMVKYMESLGLKQVQEDADLLINVGVAVNEKINTYDTNFRDARYQYMGQRNYSWQSQTVELDRYNEGTVTLDWVDRAKSKMMWHFVLSGVMAKDSEEARKNIQAGKELISKKLKKEK